MPAQPSSRTLQHISLSPRGCVLLAGKSAPVDARKGRSDVTGDGYVKERPRMHVDHVDCYGGVPAFEAVGKKAMPDDRNHFFVGLKCEIESGVRQLR